MLKRQSVSMTESTNNRDDWLAQIKESVRDKAGHQWRKERWSEFVKEVAWWLHSEGSINDEDTIVAAVGLIKYGIMKEKDFKYVAGSPPSRKDFREALEAKGVRPIVCDILFNEYVAPQQQQQQQQQQDGELRCCSCIFVFNVLVE